MENKQTYSLLTIITMIVGIVVGSGIYFRADDIFSLTHGNTPLGLLVLGLGAICITFGALSLSFIAKDVVDTGGIVSYFETYYSKKIAAGMGWFQTFIYMPTCAVVVGWAGAIFTFMLLGIEAELHHQILLGLFYNLFFIFINSQSRKLGGLIQNIATTVKLIPLLLIAFYGIFIAKPVVNTEPSFSSLFSQMSWVSALVPLMFSYDGWTISLSIASEVKDPQKNVSKALIIAPFIILVVYLAYTLGISHLLGNQQIIQLGDASVFEAGKLILGERLGNVLLAVVVISVLGVTNGISLGLIRMPQALAAKKMIPDHGLSVIDPEKQLSKKSVYFSYLIILVWSFIHYIVMKTSLFNGRDVSEISIVFSYVSYILLYYIAYKILIKKNKAYLLFIPFLATLGSLFILTGSIIASPLYISLFFAICLSVVIAGYTYTKLNVH